MPGEDIKDIVDAGAVNILFNNQGLQMTSAFIHQGLTGMNETPEAGDNFGYALAISQQRIDIADQNHPTYIAIGVPGEDVGTIVDAGVVHVLPPSDAGPNPIGSQLWSQDSANVPGACEAGDRFGEVLATRAFGGRSAVPDLLVGVPHEDLTAKDGTVAADAGMVHVFYSAGFGLTSKGTRVFTQEDSVGETIEAGDMFGAAISGGPYRGDSSADATPNDLVIAAPYEDLGSAINAGVVHYFQQTGPQVFGASRVISIADTAGQQPATGDLFGFSLTSWQFDFAAGVQTAVGAPGRGQTGAVFLLSSTTASGLDSNARFTLTTSLAGHPPVVKEQFGRVMY